MAKNETAEKQTTILVVDDEPNMRTTLSQILADEGYRVRTAGTGQEAIEKCLAFQPRVVLMDVRMPGMDGIETFRRLRRHQEGVRVILMSAYCTEGLRQAALDEGAIAFLSKPLDLEKVLDLVSEVKETAILVVERDKQTADLLGANLKEQGYRVTITGSAHDALELVEQIRFDLIFLAANLASMSGLELYLAIKEITPTSVAIMISGMEKDFDEIAREAVRRNAYTIVRKPLDIDHILGLLKQLAGKRISGDYRKPPL